MWFKKTYRIAYILVAISIGLLIVYLLSIAGHKSKGPIENLLSHAENTVYSFEESFILQQRENKRKDKLKWFNSIKNDISKLKKPKMVLLGASDNSEHDSFETIINLEDSLETTFPLIHVYNAWGSKLHEQFPKLAVETILNLGSIPVITWEPWLSDFKEEEYPGIPDILNRDKNCLTAIANGTYDKYILDWAKEAKNIDQPIFIRLAHEMNDPYRYPWGPQNNKPEEFIASWKHIHDIFQSVEANNIIWIWSPHPAYGYFEAFYPGDDYVDYVGVGILNFGSSATWSKWWTFQEIFGTHYDELTSFNKPIMITEFGSLNVGGDRSVWFGDAFQDVPTEYPAIKSILFFHYPADNTITNKEVSWYFIEDTKTKEAIKKQIRLWPDSLKFSN